MPRAGLDSEAVVAAAAELADERGLDEVSLTALAQRLGVRTPSLYSHVGGLADLRSRLGARGARELAAAVTVAAAGRARVDALQAVALTYRDYARTHPGTYAAMQRAPEPDAIDQAGAARELAGAARELVDLIVAVLAGYELHGDQAIHAVRAVRAALHGFVELEQLGGFRLEVSLDESYRVLIAMLDRGLAELGSG
jgi:AcrR family transcriptional regulator